MDLKHQKAKQNKATAKAEEDRKAAQQLEADMAQWAKDVPAEQEAVAALTQQLAEAEAKLEELTEGIQEEVEGYHQQLSKASQGRQGGREGGREAGRQGGRQGAERHLRHLLRLRHALLLVNNAQMHVMVGLTWRNISKVAHWTHNETVYCHQHVLVLM
jgi:flagellar biosynthesis/type III secretory pathway protein FliH